MGQQPAIELRHASKRFLSGKGTVHVAVSDLTFTVGAGELVAVVGPTGCGKSTTLSLVSGLEPASEGEALVHGETVSGIPAGIGYMFQNDVLIPWRTVLGNVTAGLTWGGTPKSVATERARDWLERVGLSGFADAYPHQLSGGMRKRVALAQVLITEPSVLLMDEPFSALDVQTRAMMQNELLELWSGSGAAVIFVTHDLDEAIALADRVVVMTAAPARVKDIFTVGLPRPRNVEELRMTPEFTAVYREIWQSLSTEVAIARKSAMSRVA